MVHSARRFALWICPVMAYLIIGAYFDVADKGTSLWIFFNTFATGFNLSYEQFYFEVIFPLFMIFWGCFVIATE